MNPLGLLVSAAATFTAARAVSIGHDKVQPFAQPEPNTNSEKAAIAFKPLLRMTNGCAPYPAVNAAGETSAGLKGTGSHNGGCEGSTLGSQVYGRAGWHGDLWAIMYAWYFPKDMPTGAPGVFKKGRRHDWANVVVWISNPAVETPTFIGISTGFYAESNKHYRPPPNEALNGTHCRIQYRPDWDNGGYHAVDTSRSADGCVYQDLIMWEQLTEEARTALQETDFGENAKVPFNDANFEASLQKALL
ncbi:hypothetical protein PHYBOEH_004177 [Phytophthora boehmeriae]|uniref:Uncharacterized protein n=1 Tax=Phytophthora boehmeriae TaxID=109152 RepID=A0A8T1WMD2_9STRA|nr:hypothetical protein PHYBOEH_004177 [Phytophthora boehmeriae]